MATLREVMAKDPITVPPDVTVAAAAATMVKHRVGSVLVAGEEDVFGILTERDVLRAAGADGDLLATRVREWMTVDPTTAPPDMDSEDALATMLEGGFRHLPVAEGDHVVGIVSLRDVLGERFSGRQPSGSGSEKDPAPRSSPTTVQERRERMFEAIRGLQQASRASGEETGAWRTQLTDAVDVVDEVVVAHVAATEGPDGLHEELVRLTSGRLQSAVRRLARDHDRSRELLSRLRAGLAADADADALRRLSDELCAQLEAHHHRGSDLLWQAYGVELGGGD